MRSPNTTRVAPAHQDSRKPTCSNKDNTVKKKKEKKGDDGLVDKHKLLLRKEDSTFKHTSILSRFSISTALDSTPAHLDPCGHLCPTSPILYLAARRALKNPS